MGLEETFRRTTSACIRLYRLSDHGSLRSSLRRVAEDLRRQLEKVWGGLARIYAQRTEGWEADAENPGYLVREGSQVEVKVPYHLASDFPTGQTLARLTELGLDVRSSPEGVICLSGSSTFWEALEVVGDVDFCEYVALAEETPNGQLWKQLQASAGTRTDELVCLRVEAFDETGSRLDLSASSGPHAVCRAKADFLSGHIGELVEATNVILPVQRDDPTDQALEMSFALQEAPMGGGSWAPQQLLDPISIGEYAEWLQEEIQGKMDSDLVKAAKRGLSLARISGYNEYGGTIISILQRGPKIVEDAIQARSQLLTEIKKLKSSSPEIGKPFLELFEETVEGLKEALLARRNQIDTRSDGPQDQSDRSIQDVLGDLLEEIRESVDAEAMGGA